jgi:hypothetical protein
MAPLGEAAGGGQPHNMQPYLVLNDVIALTGVRRWLFDAGNSGACTCWECGGGIGRVFLVRAATDPRSHTPVSESCYVPLTVVICKFDGRPPPALPMSFHPGKSSSSHREHGGHRDGAAFGVICFSPAG